MVGGGLCDGFGAGGLGGVWGLVLGGEAGVRGGSWVRNSGRAFTDVMPKTINFEATNQIEMATLKTA